MLKKPLLSRAEVIEPFARQALERAARDGPIVRLSLDQTERAHRMAVLRVSVRVGDRSLPLAGVAEAGAAKIGVEGQRRGGERGRAWLPAGATVLLSADRVDPAAALFAWLHPHGWRYRLRLKSKLVADAGHGEDRTTGAWARDGTERYLPRVQLFAEGVLTNVGLLHEAGHPEPWLIARECLPTRAAVLDYGARWGIEPLFSDFKTRGFELEDSPLDPPDRLERWMLIRSLAM